MESKSECVQVLMKEISINKHAAPALLISAFVFGHSGIIEGSEQAVMCVCVCVCVAQC